MSTQNQETSDQTDQPSARTTKDKVGKSRWQRLRKQVDKLTGKKDPATRAAKHKAKHDAKQEVPIDPDPQRNPADHESGNESTEEHDEASIGASSEDAKSCTSDGQRAFAVSESQEWIFAVQHSKQHPLYRKSAVSTTSAIADGHGGKGGASAVPSGAHMVPGGASLMRHPMHARSGVTMVQRAGSDASTGSDDTPPTKQSTSDRGKGTTKDRAVKGSGVHGPTARVQGSLVQMLADCCKVQTAVSGVRVEGVEDGARQTEGERLAAALCGATLECKDNDTVTEKCGLEDNVFEIVPAGAEAAAATDVQIALNDILVEIAPNGDVMELTPTNDCDTPTNDCDTPTNDCDTPTNDCDTPTNDCPGQTSDCAKPTSDGAKPTSDTVTSTSEEGTRGNQDGNVVHQTSYSASVETALDGAPVQGLGDGASTEEPTVPVQSNDTSSPSSSESISKHSGAANNSIAFDTNTENVIKVRDERATNVASTGAHETPTHNPPGILKNRIDSATPANNSIAFNTNSENVTKVSDERVSIDANETPSHNPPGTIDMKQCNDAATPANNSIAFNTNSENVMNVRDEIESYFASMNAHKTPTHNPSGIPKKRIDFTTTEGAVAGTPGASKDPRATSHQSDDINSTIASHKPTGHADTSGDNTANSKASSLNNKWHSLQDLNHNDHRTPSDANLSKASNVEPGNKPVPFYKIGSAGRWSQRDLSKKYTIKHLDSKPARHKTTPLSDSDHRTNSDMDLSQIKPTGRRFLHNVFIRNKAGPDAAEGNKTSAAAESKPEGRPRNTATTAVTRKKSFVQRFLHRKDISRTAQQNRLQKQRSRDTEPKQIGDIAPRPVQSDNVPVDKEPVVLTGEKHQRKGSTKDRPPPAGRYAITRMFSKWNSMSDIPSVSDGVIGAKAASTPSAATSTKGNQQNDAQLTNTWWSENNLTSAGETRNTGKSVDNVEGRKGRRHSECVLPDHKALDVSSANDAPCCIETPQSDSTENIKQAPQADSTWATEYSSSTRQGPPDNTDGGGPHGSKRVPKMSDAASVEPNQNEYKKKKPNRLNRVFARRKTVSEIPTALIQQAVQITAASETVKSPRKPSDHSATTPLGDEGQNYGFTAPELHLEAGTVYQAMQMSDDDKDATETEYTIDDPPTYDLRKKKKVMVIAKQPTQPIKVTQDRLDCAPKKCSSVVRRHSTVGLPLVATSKMSKKQLGISAPAEKVGNYFIFIIQNVY